MKVSFCSSLRGHDVLVTVDMDRATDPDQRQDVTVELSRGTRHRALRATEDLEAWAIAEAMSRTHKPTTEPAAVQAAQGATGQDAVAPVPPPVRRHPETGFECSCPNGPCPTMDRHIYERMYLQDQKYGDPWARPSVDLAEQRHFESLAAALAAALISSPSVKPTAETCRNACEEGLTLANEIIRRNRGQNREGNKR